VDTETNAALAFRTHVVGEAWVGVPVHSKALEFMSSFPEPWKYRIVEIRAFDLTGSRLCYLVLPIEVQI
jgi:hypothetical protein